MFGLITVEDVAEADHRSSIEGRTVEVKRGATHQAREQSSTAWVRAKHARKD